MNIPFVTGRGNTDRLGFLHPRDISGRSQPPARYDDSDDDRTPLSPRSVVDLEAQRSAEMAERSTPSSRFIHRFRLSLFSVDSTWWRGAPRPTSSHYSGDGGPPDTVVNGGPLETPKTPEFRIGVQDLPSTRLHLPNLARTWTQGSNGPPSRPATGHDRDRAAGEVLAEPAPAVLAARGGSRGTDSSRERHGRRRRHRRGGSGGSRSHRSHRRVNSSEERTRSSEEGNGESRGERRRRRRRQRREEGRGDSAGSGSQRSSERGPPPKNFLFCFPWIKSRRVRKQILRCFISGMFLTLILTVYLSLSITKNINNSEFTVLLILVILFVTIFFCHGLVRLCMLVMRNKGNNEDAAPRERLPEMMGPGGYAIPRRPIRVVLARDEEAAGIESEVTKTKPPAYGLWRESVRVDPDRIYWMRNEDAPENVDEARESLDGGAGPSRRRDSDVEAGGARPAAPRPPSYASDDGVSYVVEAQPRSIAPTFDVPLRASTHPAEAGRAGVPPAW